jgi:Zn-dependent peptidase ImmA (M78 family)
MAKVYQRPLAMFLLNTPPIEPPVPSDYRTVMSEPLKPLTPGTHVVIRKARGLLASATELQQELGIKTIPFTLKASLHDNPELVAETIRQDLISVNFDITSFTDSQGVFRSWKSQLETAGIFIFQLSISQKEIKGFSFIEDSVPVIVINKSDELNSRIFSLFHELGHILLGDCGICNMIEAEHATAIEKFCNHFAGAFLVPERKLLSHKIVTGHGTSFIWENNELKEIANHFKVSKEVIIRRLLTLGKTTTPVYQQWRADQMKVFIPYGKKRADKVKTSVEERGNKYVSMVFDAFDKSKINTLEMAEYLDVRTNQLSRVEEYISD